MQLIARISRLASARFLRFVGVGLAGFVVDAGLLLGLMGQGFDALVARLLSFSFAALCTWRLNRAYTFQDETADQLKQGTRYATIAVIAGILNYGTYATMVTMFGAAWAFAAITMATAMSMLVSYTGMATYVFESQQIYTDSPSRATRRSQ